MFCPTCGHVLQEGSSFCAHCGNNVEAVLAQDSANGSDNSARVQQAAQPGAQPLQQPPTTATPMAQPAFPTQVAANGAGAPAAIVDPAPARMKVLIVVLGVLAAIIVVLLVAAFLKPGGQTPGADPATSTVRATSASPAVIDATGTTIHSIERPSLVAGLSNIAEESSAPEPSAPSYTVESGLANVQTNLRVPDTVQPLLEKNGFAVMAGSGSDEFYEVYERNRYAYVPNFVTVDSMMHTYHLYFSHLMKNTERTYLSSALLQMSNSMVQASAAQLADLKGTEWEEAAARNAAFFAVGAKLLDPSAQVPAEVSSVVDQELANITSASGVVASPLLGDDSLEDYTQYIPRGYYAGDPALEAYFKAMMWYGRINFTQASDSLDRSALLMTLALHDAALEDWESIYTITSFFAGASDDCGYYEYYPIAEAVYGEGAAAADVAKAGEEAWTRYHAMTQQMPAPQINSIPVYDEGEDADHEEEEKGFRIMGQRFTIDAMIMQNLIYNKVGANSSGANRMLPNALDVPAALGSDEALSILDSKGDTGYSGYTDNMNKLRTGIEESADTLWPASLYSQWLFTLDPLLDAKGEGYPSFMQSTEWTRKNLQSYLGSYTELKHDTILYSKQVMAEMGGGNIQQADDRGYVEPEAETFTRLANLTSATAEGLSGYNMLGAEDAQNLELLRSLAGQLATIASKELAGETPTDEEFELIRSYGGQLEHFWQEVYKNESSGARISSRNFPAAIVADVATDANSGTVLELGTGKVSDIYVIVPVEGSLRLAKGSVFSFYQFEWPMGDRLTDSSWREMMGLQLSSGGGYNKPNMLTEDWTTGFQYDVNRG